MPAKKSKDTLVPVVIKNDTPESGAFEKSSREAALKRLEKIEKQIKEGIIKYFETGLLLEQIRDEKLYEYRDCHSFSEYCKKIFAFSRSYGYRLIAYCNVWNLLKDDAKSKIPERMIRALATVKEPEERQKIWDRIKTIANGELPTYQIVEHEVKAYREQKQLTDAEFDPEASPDLVFCRSLKAPVSKSNPVEDLIEKSDGKYNVLLRAAKEMFRAEYLDSDACEALKGELLRRHEEFLDNLFNDDGSKE